jgi:hypothetical protein
MSARCRYDASIVGDRIVQRRYDLFGTTCEPDVIRPRNEALVELLVDDGLVTGIAGLDPRAWNVATSPA